MKIENLAKEAFEGVIVVQHEVQDLGKQTIVTMKENQHFEMDKID